MPFEWAPGALERLPTDIDAYEAQQVISPERPRLPQPGVAEGMPILGIFGRTRQGRPLVVICRHVGGLLWHILFVRELSASEMEWFKNWEANR